MYANPLYAFRSKVYLLCKEIYQLKNITGPDTKHILFILGCQRSGTSLMTRILNKDWNAKVYFESSSLSMQIGQEKLRLKPLPVIEEVIEREYFPLIVLKPLVETQNAIQLLEFFPYAKAIWMYRNHKDVASSHLRRFGLDNAIRNLRYIIEDRGDDWRAEHIPAEIKQIVFTHFSESMSPIDAAALFWYVRNAFFFQLGLDCHPRARLCKYDDLIIHPKQTMKKIYSFLPRPYPGDQILKTIHGSSIGKGQQNFLSKEIYTLCERLWERIENHNQTYA